MKFARLKRNAVYIYNNILSNRVKQPGVEAIPGDLSRLERQICVLLIIYILIILINSNNNIFFKNQGAVFDYDRYIKLLCRSCDFWLKVGGGTPPDPRPQTADPRSLMAAP